MFMQKYITINKHSKFSVCIIIILTYIKKGSFTASFNTY